MQDKALNREAWLTALMGSLAVVLAERGYPMPDKLRVSCSWPTTGALSHSGKARTIGQCFNPCCSKDGTAEMCISPLLDDPMRVADVLAHEMLHAALPTVKHGPKFAKAALAIGLEGKPTATVAGPDFLAWAGPMVAALGDYPHASVDVTKLVRKVQSTRMVKMQCSDCGYVARTARKWLESAGPALCPCNNEPMQEA